MEALLGTIQLFAFNFVPKGWLSCEGQTKNIIDYEAVYSLLGTIYGGDGVKTFMIPDLRGKEPNPSMGYYICVEGTYPSRT